MKLTDQSPMMVEKFLKGMGPRSITQTTRKLLAQALARAEDIGLVETTAAERSRAPARDGEHPVVGWRG